MRAKPIKKKKVETEEQLRLVFAAVEASRECIIIVDLGGKIIYANRGAEKIAGAPAEDLVGKHIPGLFTDWAKAESLIQQVLEQGYLEEESTFVDAGGREFLCLSVAFLIRDEDGHPLGMLVRISDITEWKEAEEALRESEAKHRELLENINDVVYAVDKDGTATYVSPVVESLLGYRPSEIVGSSFAEFMCQEDLPGAMENFLRVLSGDATADEYRLRTKSGEMRWVRSSNRPIFDGNGVVGGRGVLTDITQRKEVEETRRDSEERFRGIAERSFDAIVSLDIEGRVTYASPAVERMFGYRPEEMIQKRFHNFVPDSEIPKALEMIAGMKSVQNLQMEFARKDGALCTVEANASPILRDGKIVGYQAAYRDITERKEMEEALRRSEERYRTILDDMEESYYEADLVGNLTFVNDSVCRVLGYSREELIGMNNRAYMNQENAKLAYETYSEVYRTGESAEWFTWEVLRKDGERRFIEGGVYPLRGPKGDVVGFRGVARDITERKQSAEALAQSEERYRTILDEMEDAYFEVDLAGNYTFANDSNCRALGYSPDEMIGINYRAVTHEEDVEAVYRAFSEAYRTGQPTGGLAYRVIAKDGATGFTELSAFPLRNEQGEIIGFRGIGRNITERKLVEAHLKSSEERLRILFEFAPDACFLMDMEGNFVDGNKAAEEMVGYRKEELVGRSLAEAGIIPVDEIGRALALFAKNAQGKATGVSEFILNRKDGGLVAVEIRTFPVVIEGRALVLGNARDVSERKEAEEALRESEERYRTILEEMGDGYFEVTLAGSYTFVNDSMCLITGYSKEEMLRMDYRVLTPQDDVGRVYEVYNEMSRTGRPLERFFAELIRKDGQRRFCEVSASLLRNRAGEVIGFRGVHRDVTKRKEAEEALRRSEEKYRTILEDMEDSYFEVDLAGNLTFANDSTCRSLGYPREETAGMNYRDFTPEEDVGVVYQAFNQVYRMGQPARDIPWTVVRKDGTRGIVEASVFTLRNDEGEIIGFRGIGRDVTERRAVQQQLLMSSKLASIGELASGVAHELNNPLTGIMGYAQLLTAKQNVPQDVKIDLDRIYGESQRAARIVQNLLSFARRRKPEKSYFDVNELVQRTLELRDYELRTSNIGVHLDLAADLPWTMADYHQIQQVVLNIIINSEQAVAELKRRGKIRVTTGMKEGCIRICIGDNGLGISAEQIDKVFDPFFTTKEVGSGTGLGLSVCHGIVTQHGGNIYAESQKGRGTTFTVDLPLVRQTEVVIEKTRLAPKTTSPRRDEGTACILIVDDERAICDILVRALSEHGYQTDSASSARTALKKIASNGYELCIIDLKMPATSGKELYETMKRRFPGPAEKVVFMTGDTIEPATERFLVSTGRPHLAKPFGSDEVMEVVEKALGGGA